MISSIRMVSQQRLRLLAQGYLPIPVTSPDPLDPSSGKRPVLKNWAKITELHREKIEDWANSYPGAANTGVICGRIVGVDIDVDDKELVDAFIYQTSELFGLAAPIRVGRPPRALLTFRTKTPFKKLSSGSFVLPCGLTARLEILGQGQQFVAAGIHPGTAKPYEWIGSSIFDIHADELPMIDEDRARQLIDLFEKMAREHGGEPHQEVLAREAQASRLVGCVNARPSIALVAEALQYVPNEDADYDFWLRVGFSLHDGLGDDGFELWDDWSKKSRKYDAAFTRKTWLPFKKGGGVTIGTLFHLANSNGWRQQLHTDSRPTILVIDGSQHEDVDAAEQALLNSQIEIFQRGDALVRPVRLTETTGLREDAEPVRLLEVSEDWLLETFSRVARFRKSKGRTGQAHTINCPSHVVKMYLARVAAWRVPVLKALVHAPTLRHDGSIIDRPGYDAASGVYAAFDSLSFPEIPKEPDREMALKALSTLERPFKTFPFASEPDRSVAIAAVLTGLSRHLFPTAPMFGFSAPVAGAGKSLLVDLCSIIVTGRPAAVLSTGKTEEELEKRLGAAFIQGAPIISLDNCNQALKGAFLCQVLTQQLVRTRILGKSTIIQMPTNCLMLATGNNLVFVDDMTRRVVLCTLDPGVERPEERQFERDVMVDVIAQRGELVVAGLTVLRALRIAGFPKDIRTVGSFSEWSRFVRGALLWLDRADPWETTETVRDRDPVLERNIVLLNHIDRVFGPSPFTTAQLIARANAEHRGLDSNDELHFVLSQFSGGSEVLNAISVGIALGKLEGRLCDGLMLKKLKVSSGTSKWQLVGNREVGVMNVF